MIQMPTIVVEVNGVVLEQYVYAYNWDAFNRAKELSHQYQKLLRSKGDWAIFVVTQSANDKFNKSVVQMDMDGNEIATFQSSNEAANETGVCARNIRYAMKGDRPMAGGFKWKKG